MENVHTTFGHPSAAASIAVAGACPDSQALRSVRRYGNCFTPRSPESRDFDFFSDEPLDDAGKQDLLSGIAWLQGATVLQNDRNTLTVTILREGGPVNVSFLGGIATGCVEQPEMTRDCVLCVASPADLLAHKLKVIHQRAEGKDYQDIAALLRSGQRLARGLAAKQALFGSGVPTMVTLKALTYFDDVNEPWRLTGPLRAVITEAVRQIPQSWPAVPVISKTLAANRNH